MDEMLRGYFEIDAPKSWDPMAASILSSLLPGLGQVYKGQYIAGAVWFALTLAFYFVLIAPGAFLHILCIIAASSGDPYHPAPSAIRRLHWRKRDMLPHFR